MYNSCMIKEVYLFRITKKNKKKEKERGKERKKE
jgi:hypothetical protein